MMITILVLQLLFFLGCFWFYKMTVDLCDQITSKQAEQAGAFKHIYEYQNNLRLDVDELNRAVFEEEEDINNG